MDEVRNNWISTYEKVSGNKDGAMRFEAEKLMFLTVTSDSKFKKVSNFSKYNAFIELSISGLSLREGMGYIIPYGEKCSFMPGWKGRLEQISDMPGIVYVHPPQVVREDDVYRKSLGMSPQVLEHVPNTNSQSAIIDTYLVIEFTHGTRCFFMSASEILNIRNRRSKPYISYMNMCRQHNQAPGNSFEVNGQYGPYMIEPPMWITDEVQAFKKTLVRRTYNEMPNKLAKHKHLDALIAQAKAEGMKEEDAAADDFEENDFKAMTDIPDEAAGDQNAQVISSTLNTAGNQQQGAPGGDGYNGF